MSRQQLYKNSPPTIDQDERDVEDSLAPDWLEVLNRQESALFHDFYSPSMKEWADDFQEFRVCSQRAAQMMRQVRARPDRMGTVHPSGFSIPQILKKNQRRVTFKDAPSTTSSKGSTDEHTHRQKAADDSQPTHLTTARVEMPPLRSPTTSTSLAISQNVENQINQQAVASNLHRPASIAAPAAPLQTHPPVSPADAQSAAMAIAAPTAPTLPNPSSFVAPTAQLSANPLNKPTVSRANHRSARYDHKQGAGNEESHGVGQTGQAASKPAKTVSADQGRGSPHSDKGKRRIPDDDDELEHALAESMNKRARTSDTESGGKQENDGWKRSF
ncbi:hypothetical protein LTS10_001605 [Elasticomyces elasticus]|nr:hypothetical protein LTS10_001605 [Elasticomyces elasticus]